LQWHGPARAAALFLWNDFNIHLGRPDWTTDPSLPLRVSPLCASLKLRAAQVGLHKRFGLVLPGLGLSFSLSDLAQEYVDFAGQLLIERTRRPGRTAARARRRRLLPVVQRAHDPTQKPNHRDDDTDPRREFVCG
jgi:hypothetical protein